MSLKNNVNNPSRHNYEYGYNLRVVTKQGRHLSYTAPLKLLFPVAIYSVVHLYGLDFCYKTRETSDVGETVAYYG